MSQPPLQEQYFKLLQELQHEQDAFLRGTPRARYELDDGYGNREEVTRAEWRTVTTDRCNQLALECQLGGVPSEPGAPVTLDVPPGSGV